MSYSENPFSAVKEMYDEFGLTQIPVNDIVLDYRMGLLREELKETELGVENRDSEAIVDGHVDLIVVAIGNLALFGVDIHRAFDQVMEANMKKVLGKRVESDPSGVSLAKPHGWTGPSHEGNHGDLDEL